jgi:hypothetical protein
MKRSAEVSAQYVIDAKFYAVKTAVERLGREGTLCMSFCPLRGVGDFFA